MKPIYSTAGDWVALLDEGEGRLYDTRGEWIAWLDGREVYTRDGEYVGFLAEDGRVLRERVRPQRPLRPVPPSTPNIKPPARVPLPPYFAELPWNQVDVFDEEPEVFRFVSERRPDWED
ncbi:MAG TPA: hypothetical protein ENN99_14675 [Chloroflexi bacterium]|nr:hypothetical protein [Chloroflexota bacterium]